MFNMIVGYLVTDSLVLVAKSSEELPLPAILLLTKL